MAAPAKNFASGPNERQHCTASSLLAADTAGGRSLPQSGADNPPQAPDRRPCDGNGTHSPVIVLGDYLTPCAACDAQTERDYFQREAENTLHRIRLLVGDVCEIING